MLQTGSCLDICTALLKARKQGIVLYRHITKNLKIEIYSCHNHYHNYFISLRAYLLGLLFSCDYHFIEIFRTLGTSFKWPKTSKMAKLWSNEPIWKADLELAISHVVCKRMRETFQNHCCNFLNVFIPSCVFVLI